MKSMTEEEWEDYSDATKYIASKIEEYVNNSIRDFNLGGDFIFTARQAKSVALATKRLVEENLLNK